VAREARPQPHADQESTEVADQALDKPQQKAMIATQWRSSGYLKIV
jgi:hypothetical protein